VDVCRTCWCSCIYAFVVIFRLLYWHLNGGCWRKIFKCGQCTNCNCILYYSVPCFSIETIDIHFLRDSQKYDRISSLLCDLHWLRVPESIKFRLAVLTFHCRSTWISVERTAVSRLWRTATTTAVRVVSETDRTPNLTEQPATVPSALPLLAYYESWEQPTSRRCHFTVVGNFQGTAKHIFQSHAPLTTVDFVTCLCGHLDLRRVKYCRTSEMPA